jgi:hypothetical protein
VNDAIRFGLPMRPWQRECARLRARFVVLALHRRAGKTELALKKLLDAAVKCRQELPLYFYVAPFLKQAKTIAWARLKQMVAPMVLRGERVRAVRAICVQRRHDSDFRGGQPGRHARRAPGRRCD